MASTSGINPTEYNVLVEPEKVEEKSRGGILLSDATLDRKQAFAVRGKLLAVSPLAFTYERWPEGTRKPQVGDTVIMTKAAGVMVEGLDGKEYRLLKDKDVAATLGDIAARHADLDRDIAEANRETANV